MNVAAYCRVSTDDEDQKNSFNTQKNFFEDYINKHDGWNLFEIYADQGITGTSTKKRTNFNKMIQDALNGAFELILTKEVSRFARNTVDTLSYTRELKSKGVSVYFISDNINTGDNDGELRLSIMATLAQEESRKTSERVKWGIRKKMEDGWVYAPNLIGYDVVDGKLIANRAEAKIVQLIFDMYSNQNKSALYIAKHLTAQGIMPVKRIKTWSSTTIMRILNNEKYAGDLVQAKTVVANYLDHISVKNSNEQLIIHEGHHEPIIDRDTWDRVKKRINTVSAGASTGKKTSNRYWCSGKIICGMCNTNYSVSSKKLVDGSPRLSWKCIQSIHFGHEKINDAGQKVGCSNSQINMNALNYCVKFAFQQFDIDYNKIAKDLELGLDVLQGVTNDNDSRDVDEIKSRMSNLNKKKENAIDLYLEKTISSEEMKQMKAKYDRELRSLRQLLDIESEKSKGYANQLNIVDSIKDNIREIIDNETFCNDVLYDSIVEKIIAYPHRLHIHFLGAARPVAVIYSTHGRGDKYTVNCHLG